MQRKRAKSEKRELVQEEHEAKKGTQERLTSVIIESIVIVTNKRAKKKNMKKIEKKVGC